MNFSGNTTAQANLFWAIVIVRDGLSASTIATSDGAAMYEPEQDVLAFGVVSTADLDAGAGPAVVNWEGTTKSMRKLMGGDKLQFISINPANAGVVKGCVQLFCKS